MALYVNDGGTRRSINALYTQKNGTTQCISAAYTQQNGTQATLFSGGTALFELSVGDTVSITESGGAATYRVWEKNYLGTEAILLVRECVLSTPRIFDGGEAVCYAESEADAFLRTEYLQTLPQSLQNKLITVDLPVTQNDDTGLLAVQTVPRACFLLSVAELWGSLILGASIPAEGERLAYHIQYTSECGGDPLMPRIARDESGEQCAWWLRSAYPNRSGYTRYGCCCGIGGSFERASYEKSMYLRPALAVNPRYILES